MTLDPVESGECIAGCLPHAAAARWLPDAAHAPLPALNDPEAEALWRGLPEVVDAHVHLFPDRTFEAIWRWFEQYGWPIRYKLYSEQTLRFLLGRRVSRVVGLAYSHKPGMARSLNAHMAALMAGEPRLLGLATVLPGEPDARGILRAAFAAGLRGVKLHCHVQSFSPDAAALHEVYETCVEANRPLVMHAGREPSSPQYPIDPYALCSVERVERVLRDHPKLKLCVPHLGADEFAGYEKLLERYDGLWLDTTMAVAEYFPVAVPRRLLNVRPERILYGTDFPNLPYAWDRELRWLEKELPGDTLAGICGKNALALYV